MIQINGNETYHRPEKMFEKSTERQREREGNREGGKKREGKADQIAKRQQRDHLINEEGKSTQSEKGRLQSRLMSMDALYKNMR